MRRVLLVVPDAYPPAPAVGCVRVLKFRKYLPEFGYESVVLTTPAHGHLPNDAQHHVHRPFDPQEWIFRLLRRGRMTGRPTQRSQRLVDSGGPSGLTRLKRGLLDVVAVPDIRCGWLPSAVLAGMTIIRRRGVDVVMSDSPSETAHLVAYCLARLSGTPWVADFRDGWLFESLKMPLRRRGWRRRVEGGLEKLVAQRADAIVTVSEPISRYFRETYPGTGDRAVTIPNGYDPDDWTGIRAAPRDPSKLLIVYTGSFGGSRATQDPRVLLDALRQLPSEVRRCLELRLVGYLAPEERSECERGDLADIVRMEGEVSRDESLAHQLAADVLLLLVGRDLSVATSKLYEYLYAGRPILAIAPTESAAASIVRQTDAGWVVPSDDVEALSAVLHRLYTAWRERTLAARSRGIERYHRRYLTGELARVFCQAVERRAGTESRCG